MLTTTLLFGSEVHMCKRFSRTYTGDGGMSTAPYTGKGPPDHGAQTQEAAARLQKSRPRSFHRDW